MALLLWLIVIVLLCFGTFGGGWFLPVFWLLCVTAGVILGTKANK